VPTKTPRYGRLTARSWRLPTLSGKNWGMPKTDAKTMAENLRSRMKERGIKSVAQLAKAVEKKTGKQIARETLRRWVRHGVAHIHGGDKKSTRVQLAAVAQFLGFESIESLWQKPVVLEAFRVLGEVVVSDELYQFVKRLRESELISFVLSRFNRELDICDAFVREHRRLRNDNDRLDDEAVWSVWNWISENWGRIYTMSDKTGDEIIEEILGGPAEERRLKREDDDGRMRARPSHMPTLGSSIERKPEPSEGDHDEISELQKRYERDVEEAEWDRRRAKAD
jgi:hypothetical protein